VKSVAIFLLLRVKRPASGDYSDLSEAAYPAAAFHACPHRDPAKSREQKWLKAVLGKEIIRTKPTDTTMFAWFP
jgi:hypothetical protein